jgi:hypothetical protein
MSEDLVERQLMPALDLLDANRNPINESWTQTHTVDNADELIYGGIKDGESKTITITGIMADVDAGQELWTNTIKFATASSTIDLIDIQALAIGSEEPQIVSLREPITYERNQSLKIYFNTKSGATGKTDRIILVGRVVEPRGMNIG